ncbi:short-chain dehydrogenase [Sporosarcina sp. NCCP-2716]|uniref:SDR family NAD(P)-dependent oxidoreductase n=1 Tax=Sporosarcina sp. NCCP-2716 TaxID=2943679 RepID=UPI00203C8448|nr:SDR family NAD(P)-dependent oxidoreductase [Sporosarcina sp. NCCP-2716]GKV69521.1 short-chain dehydrogenase [Sporosarcina sp. NCCP-2716]
MEVYIISGASKGIGAACLQALEKQGKTAIGIARSNPDNRELFEELDLTDRDSRKGVIARLLAPFKDKGSTFTLINNAGTVEPVGKTGMLSAEETRLAVELNLTAPLELANQFIECLAGMDVKKQIVNISSGAGRNALEGWGVYCATKAALDRFSEVVRLEQQREELPVGIVSIAPGIIDTGMQETIRSSGEDGFPALGKFIEYKETGQLSSPEETASRLLSWIGREDLTKADVISRLN